MSEYLITIEKYKQICYNMGMTDSNPDQLRLDMGDEPKLIGAPEEQVTERVFKSTSGRDVTESEIDRLAETGQFTYYSACIRLGVDPKDFFPEEKKTRPRKPTGPIAVEIGKRAAYLLEAAYDYRESVEAGKRMREILNDGAESSEVDKATIDEQQFRYAGDSAISKLMMEKRLVKAGFNRHEISKYARDTQQELHDLFVSDNPQDQASLIELVKIWKAQKHRQE